jgi:hypothetical protein
MSIVEGCSCESNYTRQKNLEAGQDRASIVDTKVMRPGEIVCEYRDFGRVSHPNFQDKSLENADPIQMIQSVGECDKASKCSAG